jgi:integrase
MIGLLAVTAMRVGEVIALTRADIDWGEGVITVRNSKFNKSRELPLDPTTVEALGEASSSEPRSFCRHGRRPVWRAACWRMSVEPRGGPPDEGLYLTSCRTSVRELGNHADTSSNCRASVVGY